MITPGLLRRSLIRAAQWRLLVLWLGLAGVASWVSVQGIGSFFQRQMSHWPGAAAAAAKLTSNTITELLLSAQTPESAQIGPSFSAGFILILLFAPFFAAATIAAMRSDEALRSRPLLEGAGTYYGRMLRMVFAGLIPIAVAGGISAVVTKWATSAHERAITEAQSNSATHISMVLYFCAAGIAFIWLDAARAQFAAQPERRSAFLAVFSGGWLMLRRPLRSIFIGLATGVAALVPAGIFLIVRQQVGQGKGSGVFIAFLLSQCAVLCLAWGRAARLIAFAELAGADHLDRKKTAAAAPAQVPASPPSFEMAPPKTSPPPVYVPAPPPAVIPDTLPSGAPSMGSPPAVPEVIELPPPDQATIDALAGPSAVAPEQPITAHAEALPPAAGSGTAAGQ